MSDRHQSRKTCEKWRCSRVSDRPSDLPHTYQWHRPKYTVLQTILIRGRHDTTGHWKKKSEEGFDLIQDYLQTIYNFTDSKKYLINDFKISVTEITTQAEFCQWKMHSTRGRRHNQEQSAARFWNNNVWWCKLGPTYWQHYSLSKKKKHGIYS